MSRPAGTLSASLLATLLAALLVASALALVTSQYRARQLFADLELAQQEAKALTYEDARLRSELGRASQPATVEAVARHLGMRPIVPDRIVMLSVPEPVPAPVPVPVPGRDAAPAAPAADARVPEGR